MRKLGIAPASAYWCTASDFERFRDLIADTLSDLPLSKIGGALSGIVAAQASPQALARDLSG